MTLYFCKALLSQSFKNPYSRFGWPPKFYPFSIFFLSSSSSSRPEDSSSFVPTVDYLVSRHNFSVESASKASSVVTHVKDCQLSDSVLSHLKGTGFSQDHLEKVIRVLPSLLNYRLEKIKPKIRVFQDLGFSPSTIADIISSDPWILVRNADNELGPSLLTLESVLGSREDVAGFLKRSAWLLHRDLQKSLVPNIEFMKSCGISISQLIHGLYSFPRLFIHKPNYVKDLVKRADELGADRKSRSYLFSIRVLGSMSMKTWESKLQLFKDLGLPEDDITFLFRRQPGAFAVSEKKLKEIVQFLLNRGFDFPFAYKNPEVFLCSLAKRLEPRCRVMEALEAKLLLPKKPGFMSTMKMPNHKFCEKYVRPYPDEIKKTYIASGGHMS